MGQNSHPVDAGTGSNAIPPILEAQVSRELHQQHTHTLIQKKNRTQLIKALAQTTAKDKCSHSFLGLIRSQDVFGQKVEFTYKGHRHYRTTIGAVVSILLKLVLFMFIFYEMYVIFSRKHPTVSTKYIMRNPDSPFALSPFEMGFNMAFGIQMRQSNIKSFNALYSGAIGQMTPQKGAQSTTSVSQIIQIQAKGNYDYKAPTSVDEDPWIFVKLDPSIASFKAFKAVKNTVDYGTQSESPIPIVQQDCNSHTSTISSVLSSAIEKLSHFYCLDQQHTQELELNNFENSMFSQYSEIQVQLATCKNSSSTLCKSQALIDKVIGSMRIQIIYTNSNMNFKEFDDRQKIFQEYLAKPITIGLDPNSEQQASLYIQSAETQLFDHVFFYFQQIQENAYMVDEFPRYERAVISQAKGIVAQLNLRLDQKYAIYGRVADNLISGLESIGGFYESMMHIGFLLVFFFQERLFKSSFLKQLYQVAAPKPVNSKIKIPPIDFVLDDIDNHDASDSILKNILDTILLRKRFGYGYPEIFHFLIKCRCLVSRHRKKDQSSMDKSHLLYDKGNAKLGHELDIINLVRSIRQLRLLSQVLIGPTERMLLKFQRKNMIETTSSSSDSDHHDYDTVKLLNSKKGLVKLQQIVKIKKSLDQLKDQEIGQAEKNMMKGIFVRRPQKYKTATQIKLNLDSIHTEHNDMPDDIEKDGSNKPSKSGSAIRIKIQHPSSDFSQQSRSQINHSSSCESISGKSPASSVQRPSMYSRMLSSFKGNKVSSFRGMSKFQNGGNQVAKMMPYPVPDSSAKKQLSDEIFQEEEGG
ncbi:hypothetical protein FGO68_gene16794 [Halteria grandinella]|uniref:Uncharacterized protein n=1 Tax=Halteria grandinella TaxID=5974 RepID=A0A8J8T7C3_HALGN|nr:hypothetical protein FGO68_gene16794 [Halteria grandinella]